MISWAVYDDAGQPAAGIPIGAGGIELLAYRHETAGPRTPPTLQNLGGGKYGFEPPLADLRDGVVYLVKNGDGFPRYWAGSVAAPGVHLDAWVMLDADGSLWTGAPSFIGSYTGPSTPPPVVAALPHLMAIRGNASVVALGDMSILAKAPAGAEPPYFHVTFSSGPSPAALASPSTPTPNACVNQVADLSDAIALLGSGCYVVTRKGVTSMLDGRRVAPPTTTFTISGSVQPLTGRELQRLPEGLRARESMALFTVTELFQARPEAGQEADRLAIDGGVFEVSKAERWQALGNYFRCVVSRVRS